jgi:hypothetical protein
MIGLSDFSSDVSALAAKVPDAPTNVANVESDTGSYNIGL